MFDDLVQILRNSGGRAGASLDEVKQAYHDMVWVWHPDRLPDDLRLQDKDIRARKRSMMPMRRSVILSKQGNPSRGELPSISGRTADRTGQISNALVRIMIQPSADVRNTIIHMRKPVGMTLTGVNRFVNPGAEAGRSGLPYGFFIV